MRGAIIGDIAGSIFEGTGFKGTDFPLFGAGCRFTDDSVLTVAVADAVMREEAADRALRRWARRYPDAGYGGMFMRWIHDDLMGAYGSYGNGAPMRISAVAWLARDDDEAMRESDRFTAVTHDHPDAMAAARAVVRAIRLARAGHSPKAVRVRVAADFDLALGDSVAAIRRRHGFDITARGTVGPALVCAFEADDVATAVRNAISLGGDADTLAAIAGAVAEGLHGVPATLWAQAETYLPADIREVVARFDEHIAAGPPQTA